MIIDRLLAISLCCVALMLIAIVFSDDGMATCLHHHSFDVCHDSLY